MAILYDATLTPGKRDLVKGWLPSRSWFDGDLHRKPHASFRFDDPEGQVGVECFLFGPEPSSEPSSEPGSEPSSEPLSEPSSESGPDASTLLVPMSYRGAPLEGAEEHLIGTTQHSVLGQRWVYDGCADPVAVSAILTAITTGGHEAELTMEEDGRTVRFDPTCSVRGSGSSADVVRAGAVAVLDAGDPTVTRAGDLELVLARVVGTPVDGDRTLTAEWAGHGPVVVAAARPSG
jgi:hypothetical protein